MSRSDKYLRMLMAGAIGAMIGTVAALIFSWSLIPMMCFGGIIGFVGYAPRKFVAGIAPAWRSARYRVAPVGPGIMQVCRRLWTHKKMVFWAWLFSFVMILWMSQLFIPLVIHSTVEERSATLRTLFGMWVFLSTFSAALFVGAQEDETRVQTDGAFFRTVSLHGNPISAAFYILRALLYYLPRWAWRQLPQWGRFFGAFFIAWMRFTYSHERLFAGFGAALGTLLGTLYGRHSGQLFPAAMIGALAGGVSTVAGNFVFRLLLLRFDPAAVKQRI
ncbi:MAG: hypothetical protein V1846_04320 [Candidatus Komeilibacteria bacterium]